MRDAYDNVEVRVGWGGCSLFLLALIVAVAVTLPLVITYGREWVRLAFLMVPAGALAGVVAGALGVRRRGVRGLALLGLVLNGAVLLAITVAVTWAVVR